MLYVLKRILAVVPVLGIVAVIVFWLWGNFTRNTQASGIPTSFDFLSNPATFTIPGADFSANEPVRNAYIVGLLNTLRVSVVGVILATILGTLIGIGRLSRNWVTCRPRRRCSRAGSLDPADERLVRPPRGVALHPPRGLRWRELARTPDADKPHLCFSCRFRVCGSRRALPWGCGRIIDCGSRPAEHSRSRFDRDVPPSRRGSQRLDRSGDEDRRHARRSGVARRGETE